MDDEESKLGEGTEPMSETTDSDAPIENDKKSEKDKMSKNETKPKKSKKDKSYEEELHDQKMLFIFVIVDIVILAILIILAIVVIWHPWRNNKDPQNKPGQNIELTATPTGKPTDPENSSQEGTGESGEGTQNGTTPVPTPGSSTTTTPVPTPGTSTTGTPTPTPAGQNNTPTPAGGNTDVSDIDGLVLTYGSNNSWENNGVSMYGLDISLTNHSDQALSSWTLVAKIPGLASVEGWNGTWTVSGDTLTVTNADYNGNIAVNNMVFIGCNIGVKGALNIESATINGSPCTIVKGSVDQNAQNQNNNNNNNNGNNGNNNNNNNNNNNKTTDVAALLKRSENAVQGDDWLHTDGKRILDANGKEVWLTGVNWFGYNTGTNTFDGLWNSELEPTVKAIADHGFNLIRVPISAQLLNQWAAGEYPKANYNNAYNQELNSMNSLEIFEYFLVLAEKNGIKVMPDIHSAETNASGHNVNLWYTDKVSAEQYYSALEWAADRWKDNDTIIAYDLKNEPHGKPYEGKGAAIWNDSKADNNWKYVAETAAARILAKNPNVLIMVEGIEIYPKDIKANGDFSSTDDKQYDFNWWGGNLRGVKDNPVDLGKYQNKLVYSPHDYGPTVYKQPWFDKNYTYDTLMADCWEDNWFYIYEDNTAPLLIGEWGGFMTEPNLTWMTHMRTLIGKYHLNHTFWCLNANSGDTGGLLLDDFKTWDDAKYNFVKEVLWQENGKFVGLDHSIALGKDGISLKEAKGL